MKAVKIFALFASIVILVAALAGAQQPTSEKQPTGAASKPAASNQVQAAQAPAGREANKSEDENAQFKESASVKYIARLLGVKTETAYLICVIVNFVIVAALIGFALKKVLPKMFRDRTAAIQKGMEEARRSSEDANRRLREIEDKLGRLDADITQLQATATTQAEEEAGRLKSAAEEEQRRIIQNAEQEIAAAANAARRDLKAYSAELAVALAEKKIKVDPATDQELVRDFTDQLGRNGNR